MLERVLFHQVVASATPGRTEEHCVKLFVWVARLEPQTVTFVVGVQTCLPVALEPQEVSIENLKVFALLQAIDLCVVAHAIDFNWV